MKNQSPRCGGPLPARTMLTGVPVTASISRWCVCQLGAAAAAGAGLLPAAPTASPVLTAPAAAPARNAARRLRRLDCLPSPDIALPPHRLGVNRPNVATIVFPAPG